MSVKSTSKKTAFVSAVRNPQSSILIRSCNDDRRPLGIDDAPRNGVHRVERDRAEQIGQPRVVIETEAEEFLGLEKVGNRRVRLERARNRSDQEPARIVELLLREALAH